MRRAIIAAVLCIIITVAAPAARACQYCRQGVDPEAYRFMNEGRVSGSFPVDTGMGSYADVPALAPTAAPEVSALVTSAAALPARPGVPALPPPPPVAPIVATASSPASVSGASGHWADFGLLGLLSLGGVFVWRTRRTQVSPAV